MSNKDDKIKLNKTGKLLKVFGYFFDLIYKKHLLPDTIYQNLKKRPVKQKIHLIIINSSLPILTILAAVFAILIFSVLINQRTTFNTKIEASQNALSFFETRLKAYAQLVTEEEVIIKELLSNTANSNRMQNAVYPLLKRLKVNDIRIIDKEGIVQVRAKAFTDVGKDLSKNILIKEALTRNKSFRFLDKLGNTSLLNYAQSITYQNEILGVVIVSYVLDYKFALLLKQISGTANMIAVNDKVVASSYGKVATSKLSDINSGFWLKLIIEDNKNSSTELLDHRLLTFNMIDFEKNPASLNLVLTQNNFSSEIALLLAFVLSSLLAFIAFVLSIALAVNVSRFIETGVDHLKDGMQKILEGNLDFKIPKLAGDEFGQLAESFNSMSFALKSSYENLTYLNNVSQQLSMLSKTDEVFKETIRLTDEVLKPVYLFILEEEPDSSLRIIYSIDGNFIDTILSKDLVNESRLATSVKVNEKEFSFLKTSHFAVFSEIKEENKAKKYYVIIVENQLEGHSVDIFLSVSNQLEKSLARIHRMQMSNEIATAQVVQQTLIPQTMPVIDGVEVFGTMHPAKGIGGDYFDFITEKDSNGINKVLWMVLGDVSGKGVPAGLIMVMVRTFLHSMSSLFISVKKLFLQLNDFVFKNSDSSKFMTGVLARYERTTNVLQLVGGGHETLAIYRHSKNLVEEYDAGGTILGIQESSAIHELFEEVEMTLNDGDILLVFTDGITEARNRTRQEYGNEKVKQILIDNHKESVEKIVTLIKESVFDFIGNAPQHDDITITGIKKIPTKNLDKTSDLVEKLNEIQTLINLDEFDKAQKELLSLEKEYPQNPFIHCKLGHLFFKKGEFLEALKRYQRATLTKDDYVEAFNFAALSCHKLNDGEQAINFLQKAIKLEPNNVILQKNLKKITESL